MYKRYDHIELNAYEVNLYDIILDFSIAYDHIHNVL